MSIESFVSCAGQRALRSAAGAAALLLGLSSCGGYGNGCGYGCSFTPFNVPNSIAVADVNGDGVPDLVVATTSEQGGGNAPGFANVILGKMGAAGTFATGVQYATGAMQPSSIAVADLAGTGALDLVVANFGSGSVSIFTPGATAGTYQAAVSVMTGGAPNQVAIGDLDHVGKLDLVVADLSAAGNVIVLPHDPANPGKFLAPLMLPTSRFTASVAVGNLAGNSAGPLDIVAATYDANGNNGAVYVFRHGTTPGTFLAPVIFAAGAQPQAVRIADVNGDGLPDLIVANLGPGSDGTGVAGVSVLLQNAAGTFLAPVTYATPEGAIDVAVGALTVPGTPDLVVASLDPDPTGSVSVLLHNAAQPGTFLAATSYRGFGQPLSVAIADLNGDGHPDIAVADGSTATVLLQVATAPGTFAAPVQVGQ
ncbi:MAG TPA: VCBS repeat-containing protein [Steroidobacteraceae bacterium]|nr:VCBS repeat-containing protein [Steroidobacteraceae bacterium]